MSRSSLPALGLLSLLLTAPSPARAQYYIEGITLELQTCGTVAASLQTFARNGDGTVTHPFSGLCVEAVEPSDYGWIGELRLLPCLPGHLMQQFNVTVSAGTLQANSSLANTCLSWNIWYSNLSPGNEIGAWWCGQPSAANELFLFDDPFTGAIQARNGDGVTGSNLCVTVAQPSTAYTINDQLPGAIGAPWDGLGIVAGAGSARLLFDYPEPQRNQILDALFAPNLGMGVSMLKLEIGGDGMGTMGSEPAHQHFQGEPSQAGTRGTQVWLAQQAKARNPALKLYALPWSWPGWLGSTPGASTPLDNPTQAAQYVVDWMNAVKTTANLQMDYVGMWSDNWDPTLSPAYAKALRSALDAAGFTSVQLVCADVNNFECATAALQDPALLAAVDIFGDHDLPPNQDANSTGKRIWRSWSNLGGTPNLEHAPWLAHAINFAYLGGNATGMLTFSAVGSSYNSLPEWNYGPILADQPWSGWYKLTPGWYVLAHTAQFAQVGWNYLNAQVGSGFLQLGGTYVTRVDTVSGQWSWSTVVSKTTNGQESNIYDESATFTLGGNIAASTPANVYVTASCFGATGQNVSFFQGPVVVPVTSNAFTIWLAENCIYTITNQNSNTGPWQPDELGPIKAPTPFPTPLTDDFSGAQPGNPGRFWSDMNGAFEVVDDPSAGRGLQQKCMSQPITRRMTDSRPHTILGDAIWQDVDFSVTFWLTTAADTPGVGVRCNSFNDTAGTDGSSGVDHMPGFWVFFTTTTWVLRYDLKQSSMPIRSGPLTDSINPLEMHTVRLIARGGAVVVSLDGFILFRQNTTLGTSLPPPRGFVGLASGAWAQTPIFANYSVNVLGTACTDLPQVGAMPHEEACQAGTPGQQLIFTPGTGPAGQFSLAANNTLCIQQNVTADPEYRYPRTRALTLQPCDPGNPQQFFLIETTSLDAGANTVGPVTGPEGYVFNVFGNNEQDDSDIAVYPWEGGTNAFWFWDAANGALYANFMNTCMSFCTEL